MLRETAVYLCPLLVILSGMPGCGGATGDRGATNPAWGGENPQAQLRNERQRFNRCYTDWDSVVGELAVLDVDYQMASTRRRDTLAKRFDELVKQGTECQQDLIDAAIVAYSKSPTENGDIAAFLSGVVYLLVGAEEYEEALRLAQILVDRGVSGGDLYVLAGTAAFAVGEFELAEKHLRRAQQANANLGTAARYLNEIDYYKDEWQREKKLRQAESLAGDLPRVLLKTTQGELELELFENEAPNTVANFISLVERGFYDGLSFHRVIPRAVAEAGCPNGDGTGEPGYLIRSECHGKQARKHFRGSLAMTNWVGNTAGSQFCLTFLPAQYLDGRQTVFGRVVRGIEVLAKLQRRDPPDPLYLEINPLQNVVPLRADKILSAKVLRKRNHPYTPEVYQSFTSAHGQ